MIHKLPLKELGKSFVDTDYVLLVGLGFDQRCLEILKYFPREKAVNIVGVCNAGLNEASDKNAQPYRAAVCPYYYFFHCMAVFDFTDLL